jgi:GGDEF domain-containing protein
MSLQGPIIAVAEQPAPQLVEALAAAGAFPIVEAKPGDALTAFAAVNPSAMIVADADKLAPEIATEISRLARLHQPMLPVIACVPRQQRFEIAGLLPLAAETPHRQLIARLSSALRIRATHATYIGRAQMLKMRGAKSAEPASNDPLDDATILVAGRGRSYPALSVAAGERAGLIGALSVETAAQHLNSRDVDGIVIGDGFGPRMVEAFLTVIMEDSRFRDLPIAMLGGAPPQFAQSLPNFTRLDGDPKILIDHLLPYARLHAFETQLKRMLKSLDAEGMLDAESGLLTGDAFLHDLNRAIHDAGARGVGLCVARLAFVGQKNRRSSLDAARLVSRVIRSADLGCRDHDGSILVVFTETDLRHAHVVARRIASTLKNTMLLPGDVTTVTAPAITLATLKPSDNVATLLARVATTPMLAAV